MNEVLTAIYNRVVAEPHNNFYNAISGRYYSYEAPQNSTFPYAVAHTLPETYADWTFQADQQFDEILIQFDLYSDTRSASEVGTVYNHLKALFDWCSLTISGYTHLFMKREFAVRERLPEEGVWRYTVQYRVMVEY